MTLDEYLMITSDCAFEIGWVFQMAAPKVITLEMLFVD